MASQLSSSQSRRPEEIHFVMGFFALAFFFFLSYVIIGTWRRPYPSFAVHEHLVLFGSPTQTGVPAAKTPAHLSPTQTSTATIKNEVTLQTAGIPKGVRDYTETDRELNEALRDLGPYFEKTRYGKAWAMLFAIQHRQFTKYAPTPQWAERAWNTLQSDPQSSYDSALKTIELLNDSQMTEKLAFIQLAAQIQPDQKKNGDLLEKTRKLASKIEPADADLTLKAKIALISLGETPDQGQAPATPPASVSSGAGEALQAK